MEKRVDASTAHQQPSLEARTFSLLAYIQAAGGGGADILSQLASRRTAGQPVGRSTGSFLRLAALLELRSARIFVRMAQRFNEVQPVAQFFHKLRREGEAQARTLMLCHYGGECPAATANIHAPEMRRLLRELRICERGVWRLSLDEALDLSQRVKASEVSLIFDPLLHKLRSPCNEFCAARLAKSRCQARDIPLRINLLRIDIADLD